MTRPDSPSVPDPLSGEPFNPWNFRPDVAVEISGAQLRGYALEATDGSAGKVIESGLDPDGSYLVAKAGRLFGKKVLLPAGTVNHIDHNDRKIYLDRTHEQVKRTPAVPGDGAGDPDYRARVADYYRSTYQPS
jgi:hypothetical protein